MNPGILAQQPSPPAVPYALLGRSIPIAMPGRPAGLDDDAASYLSAVESADGQPLENAVAVAVNEFVVGCKLDGIWQSFVSMGFLCAARTLGGALVSLVGPNPANVNFVSADYSRKTGLVGDLASKQLNIAVDTRLIPRDSISFAVLAKTLGTTGRALIDSGRANAGASGIFSAANFRCRSLTLDTFPSTTANNFFAFSRNSSGSVFARRGRLNAMRERAAETPSFGSLSLFNVSVTPNLFCDARISFWSAGFALDIEKLEQRVLQFDAALGAAIP